MKIAVVGTGNAGLVTGTCLADIGNEVTCADIDEARIEQLAQGKILSYEPGLSEMVLRNAAASRLRFTTDLAAAVRNAPLTFLAVDTESAQDGAVDLSSLWKAVDRMAPALPADAIVVIKSTVPVGTNAEASQRLNERTGRTCRVASNPAFFKEGAAVHDFMFPDRVVVGSQENDVVDVLHALYTPFLRTDKPFLVMSPASAEMAKYVANAFLSVKISFINEMAHLCQQLDADIDDVRRGIGHDRRIGFPFLFPGVGFGGSGIPKDVRAISKTARDLGLETNIIDAVNTVNLRQKRVLMQRIEDHFRGELPGKTIGVWGLAFKPQTDDIREAPALSLIDDLLQAEARVHVHDPEALANTRAIYGDKLIYGTHPMDVLVGVDALAINTEWREFRNPNFQDMRRRMNSPVIFDGRNLFNPQHMLDAGFTYYSIGRKTVFAPSSPAQ